jgi:hypothetical protein
MLYAGLYAMNKTLTSILVFLKLIKVTNYIGVSDLKGDHLIKDLIDVDFSDKAPDGTLWLSYHNCDNERKEMFLRPDDTITFTGCPTKPALSYTGTLLWDGKKLTRHIYAEDVE